MPNNTSYIGAVQVGDSGDQISIGSTLFGVCDSQVDATAKIVTLSSFDNLLQGVTVQVKFTNGNTATSGLTLKVGSTDALTVTGNCVCAANQVIAFTYENISGTRYWRSHHNIGGAMPISGGTFTGTVTLAGQPANPNEAATKSYVDSKIPSLDNLAGAMHFRGITSTAVTNGGTQNPTVDGQVITNIAAGDVVVYNQQEFVWNGSNWQLLGDEGMYSTGSVGSASGWDPGSTPTLGTAIDADDITDWQAGSASSAVVEGGILRITNSVVPTLSYTARQVPNVTGVGTLPTLSVDSTTVVVPTTT